MHHPMFQQPWPEGEYRMFQLGFVVDDLADAARRWVDVFGVGPFHIMPRVANTCRYRGGDGTVDIHIGVAQAGPVQIELIQDFTDGPSVFRDLRDRYGHNGFHQICTVTKDYDGKKAHYAGLGYELACEFTSPGQRVAFFDTFADFGFFTEVAEEKPSFQVNLSRISRTCAEWDGTDPIRILTRDGYRTP
ncbi:VOC family protein [Mycolicibacterium moriokaense]|nr:VOC family protein [Mycolicibacterium moriokaense]